MSDIEPAFGANLEHVDGQVVVAVSGELEVLTADDLWRVIRGAMEPGPNLVLDLAEVTFVGPRDDV